MKLCIAVFVRHIHTCPCWEKGEYHTFDLRSSAKVDLRQFFLHRGISTTIDPFWDISLDLGTIGYTITGKSNNSQSQRASLNLSANSDGQFPMFYSCITMLLCTEAFLLQAFCLTVTEEHKRFELKRRKPDFLSCCI